MRFATKSFAILVFCCNYSSNAKPFGGSGGGGGGVGNTNAVQQHSIFQNGRLLEDFPAIGENGTYGHHSLTNSQQDIAMFWWETDEDEEEYYDAEDAIPDACFKQPESTSNSSLPSNTTSQLTPSSSWAIAHDDDEEDGEPLTEYTPPNLPHPPDIADFWGSIIPDRSTIVLKLDFYNTKSVMRQLDCSLSFIQFYLGEINGTEITSSPFSPIGRHNAISSLQGTKLVVSELLPETNLEVVTDFILGKLDAADEEEEQEGDGEPD